ncbi:MAG: hypothetical protein LBT04_00765 [Prevotellaceae bacterium]|nr:hypothetical protein [Prevotellaceae bacterium]
MAHYNIEIGKIFLNDKNINEIFTDEWRDQCGIVLQDGKIFSGTIAENIAISDNEINFEQLIEVCQAANILDFIKSPDFDTLSPNPHIQTV